MNKGKIGNKVIIHTILIIGAVIMVMPFVWMCLTSIKTLNESVAVPPILFPEEPQWKNFSQILTSLPFGAFYINTLLMIAGRVVFALIFSSMAAFAFARLNFPFKNFLFSVVLVQLMIPSQIFIAPQFLLAQSLGMLDTVSGLILPGLVSAFGTFLLRQFFMGLPDELEEAAILDGCNKGQIYLKIMLPLAKSGLVALGIFTALFAFKDLMWPLIVNISVDKMPLSAGLATLQGQYTTNYPELMAGSFLAIWPMLLIFIIFQKKFIEGIATSGGKL
ncbi:carbohydrate ABC transporter permease [Lederbergia sp. NSJ-179]|uniref:carbohydrate ABC transporter permease n=1 Tax=Lederbergia sp. NSJ-179 TaxID=2931402 RepID=UPI001FD444E2|nr:carbohydrate ABC transporter permease [Lederbergia sp. NSJ-179]MCJ7842317.1 carbohydrate ABC transporter permease [Lederbergia sp. NSJ-179]